MDTVSSVSNSGSWNERAVASSAAGKRGAEAAASTASSTNPVDTWTPSGEVPPEAGTGQAAAAKAKREGWGKVDLGQFREEMRARLLEQIDTSRQALKDAGVPFYGSKGLLYDVPDTEAQTYTDEQMGVGKEWGAEATSQRIVDFAMGFKGMAGDEEFMEKIRAAIEEGFKQAKDDLGELPGPTGKLFNDTYKATMDKLDKAFADMKASAAPVDPAQAVKAATTGSATASVASGLSILA
jgi:hypothetical protein